jgi:hypothetical protein
MKMFYDNNYNILSENKDLTQNNIDMDQSMNDEIGQIKSKISNQIKQDNNYEVLK